MAFVTILTGTAVTYLFGVIRRASHDHHPVVVALLKAGRHMFLEAIHFHGR